ncbi:MAG: RNA-directed DNA polymerase [Desulfuromonadales bacterium]|nr:RNA-directed DNA polymerase [Desulfuromonadales bacterium]
MSLFRDLNSGDYRIGRSVCFVVTRPKYREVWAANFRDRIVHHVVYNRIAEGFHRRFIYDSYACIPGRGVLFGAERIYRFMRQATENWQKRAWFLQADLANFFVSIDKSALQALVLAKIHDDPLRKLIKQIIWHDPTLNPYKNSPDHLFACVPPHKSLFNCGPSRGLPIGNLSSQFFANVYLDALDRHVKRELKIRRYGRYVDDVVLISSDPQELNRAFESMCNFAESKLKGRFHPDKTMMNTCDKGINFCGQILKPYRKYTRQRTARAMKSVAHNPQRYTDPPLWAARMNSYLGQCCHANTYYLRKQVAIETGAPFAPELNKVIRRKT